MNEVTKDDFLESEGIIAGSPVYFGTMAAELKKIFDNFLSVRKKMEGKIGAAFATSGDTSGGKETTMISIIQALLINGMVIVGDPMTATGHYGVSCVGKPDEKTLKNAMLLGKRVAEDDPGPQDPKIANVLAVTQGWVELRLCTLKNACYSLNNFNTTLPATQVIYPKGVIPKGKSTQSFTVSMLCL